MQKCGRITNLKWVRHWMWWCRSTVVTSQASMACLWKLFWIWTFFFLYGSRYVTIMMEDVLVKLNVEFLWLKLHSTTRRLFFYWHIGLGIEEEASEVLHLEHSFIWRWNLDASGSSSETPGNFRNVVLEKDGKDQLDRLREQWSSIT